MPATVRFFCVVGPRPLAVNNKGLDEASLDATWGELSFAFLQALWNANIDVRAITIGASHIQRNDDHKRNLQWSHWQALSSAFVRDDEWKSGKLKSSSGQKVKSQKQALAIALSEQRRADR